MADTSLAYEEYCEAIWSLQEDDRKVIQARIAERLAISRPAVSEMVRRMASAGLVDLDGGAVHLTEAGTALAQRVVRRHRLAERFLADVLGLGWAKAHEEASRWEHVIDDTVEAAMDRLLGQPTTCPHGNPIPGSGYTEPDAGPLAALQVGDDFTVSRIPEELEITPGLLEFLEGNAIQPGRSGRVLAASPDGVVTVEIEGRAVGIGEFANTRILVTAG